MLAHSNYMCILLHVAIEIRDNETEKCLLHVALPSI